MDVPVSPLAPAAFPQIAPISGVRLGSVASGIKPSGKVDLTVVVFPEGTKAPACSPRARCRRRR